MAEGDILDALELDDAGGVDKEAGAGFLDDAAVGDVEVVGFVDEGTNGAGDDEEGIEGEDDDVEVVDGGSVDAEGLRTTGYDEDEGYGEEDGADDFASPDEDEADF